MNRIGGLFQGQTKDFPFKIYNLCSVYQVGKQKSVDLSCQIVYGYVVHITPSCVPIISYYTETTKYEYIYANLYLK